MTVSLRVKGWLKPDAIVEVSAESYAEMVHECRRVAELNERLTAHSEALQALLRAIKDHGTSGEDFADAYRVAVVAVQ
jgi:hypothetical protein